MKFFVGRFRNRLVIWLTIVLGRFASGANATQKTVWEAVSKMKIKAASPVASLSSEVPRSVDDNGAWLGGALIKARRNNFRPIG